MFLGIDVMILKFFEKFGKKYLLFAQTTASFSKNVIITLVFEKNAIFFAENWQKMAENCDHNIDPSL
jgi:hypothetical protein